MPSPTIPTKVRSPLARSTVIALALTAAVTACGHTDQRATAGTAPPATLPSQAPLNPPGPLDAAYRSDVERNIAAHLHLTPTAITSKLRAEPGATLLNLAKPLGLAQDQLASVVSSSLRDATGRAVQTERLTAQQGANEQQYWSAQDDGTLVSEVSYWFVHDTPQILGPS